jgi:hypothetical protein
MLRAVKKMINTNQDKFIAIRIHLMLQCYAALFNGNGWLGEASTEIVRKEDLHLLGGKISTINPKPLPYLLR